MFDDVKGHFDSFRLQFFLFSLLEAAIKTGKSRQLKA